MLGFPAKTRSDSSPLDSMTEFTIGSVEWNKPEECKMTAGEFSPGLSMAGRGTNLSDESPNRSLNEGIHNNSTVPRLSISIF